MTLLNARALLNVRLGRQYNQDADGQTLLDHWLNAACRFCWDQMPIGFNETKLADTDATWPTIASNMFTLPSAAKSLLELKVSLGSDDEDDVAYTQEGRIITIVDTNIVPTRMVFHSFYVDITTTSDSLSAYIPDYLIIELAAYFATGETKDQNDQNPIQINKAMVWYENWLRSFSIRRPGASTPYHGDGKRLDRRDGVYSAGTVEPVGNNDLKGLA